MKHRDDASARDRIISAIEENEVFLILTHVSPDGDSIGSLVALWRVLVHRGKQCFALFPGDMPPEYLFLLGGEDLLRSLPSGQKWDVVVLLDIPSISRLPLSLNRQIPPCKELINIDHHESNDIRGTINWVDPSASSVGEMLCHLLEHARYDVSSEVATALYTAILTDTGSFRFPNTTSSSLRAAARLVTYGVNPARVAQHVYGSHSLRKFQLLGLALATLQTCFSGKVAYMWVTKKMLDELGVSPVEADGFINFPREIRGVEVAILFKQEGPEGEVKVSLRSKRRNVVVSRVAEMFHGGGHPLAAGCTLSGSAETVQELILKAIAEELERAGMAASASSLSGSPSKG